MNLVRCPSGHFYDADRYADCPHCSQPTMDTVTRGMDPSEWDNTVVGNPGDITGSDVIEPASVVEDDSQNTIGYFGETEPVVGWLVATKGAHYGTDFKLRSGRNFIGRAADMDVILNMDGAVSRSKHAVVVYEPKANIFLAQPGGAKELFYLNGKVVLGAVELNAYDVISVGDTNLLFIPCCSDKFNWDEAKKANEAETNA